MLTQNLTPESLEQFNQAQEGLTSSLSRLMLVVERYPDLKANENFLDLQAQLEATENRIAVERRKFNEVTQSYNAYIRKFPQLIYAGMLDLTRKFILRRVRELISRLLWSLESKNEY